MQILNDAQIRTKIKRLAIEILENNQDERVVFLGINKNGYRLAKYIWEAMEEKAPGISTLQNVRVNAASPLESEITIDCPTENLENAVLIVVDDVANTGRTLFYAMKPILDFLPKKIEVAVMVDRRHKSFPVYVHYVGTQLSTTLSQNIDVDLQKKFTVTLT